MATKVGNAIRSVVSAVKNVIKGGNLGANAIGAKSMSFPVGVGLTAPQKNAAQAVLTPNRQVTQNGLTTSLKNVGKLSTLPTNASVSSNTLNLSRAISSGGIQLSKLSAPTSADGITGDTSVISLLGAPSPLGSSSSSGTSTSGTSGSAGTSAGLGTGTAYSRAKNEGIRTEVDQQIKDAQSAEEKSIADAQKESQNWLQELMRQKPMDTQAERANLQAQFETKKQQAEIDSLQQSLGEIEADVATQIAQANDKLGTNNFINNQIQQIERNAAPKLNRLRAEINFKTGMLAKDEQLIEQAIQDYSADKKFAWQQSAWIYDAHRDIVDKMDDKYQKAMAAKVSQDRWEYEQTESEARWKADFIRDNNIKGATLSASIDGLIKMAAKTNFGGSSGNTEFRDINLGGQMTRIFTDKNGNEIRREVLGSAGDTSKAEAIGRLSSYFSANKNLSKADKKLLALKEGISPDSEEYKAIIKATK